ncbi:hypothetical protein [Streptomyces sp. NPDC096339]|uniref:hypothetical protein n=1 Tax=Streptomyces sp. NPDC096339 TaxID=3366086 RepID=UPI0037F6FBB7
MKIGMKSLAGVVAGAALLGAVSVVPAYAGAQAEGWFTSSLTNWKRGDESRRWWDNNDTWDYTGIYFENCVSDGATGFSHAELDLYKDISYAPDRYKGSENNYCGWVDYGDPDDAGNYYFQLYDIYSGGRLTVKYLKVAW